METQPRTSPHLPTAPSPHSPGDGQPPISASPNRPNESHESSGESLPRIGTLGVLLIVLAFAGLLGGLFLLGWIPRLHNEAQLQADAKAERDSRPVVDVAQPKKMPTTFDLTLPGDARSMQNTAIFPRANGYLKHLFVDIGDHVNANQLLAEIDTPELDADLHQAEAALKQVQANEGKARVDLKLAQLTLDRYKDLAKAGAEEGKPAQLVTQQDIDEKQAAYDQANAAYAAAKASSNAAQANVDRLKSLQAFEKVLAPFAGTITARNYDIGALLSSSAATGKELFRIDQNETLRVFVNVPQAYIATIRPGQKAEFLVRNFADKHFIGEVVRSTGALDPNTRTLAFEVDVPNPDHLLFAGMYGQVQFHIEQTQPQLTVPTSALVYSPEGLKVALVDDGKVHFQKIAVGRDLGTEVEIAQGLSGTESVITNPDERLSEGAAVQTAGRVQTAETTAPKSAQALAR